MRVAEAVVGIGQLAVPGLLALFFGEVTRRGERTRVLRLLQESGRRHDAAAGTRCPTPPDEAALREDEGRSASGRPGRPERGVAA